MTLCSCMRTTSSKRVQKVRVKGQSTPRFSTCLSNLVQIWASTCTSQATIRAVCGRGTGSVTCHVAESVFRSSSILSLTGTIELIDVLWLGGNAITAAFEIESTISIFSGLLRMSDLLARQASISVPLFLVAPDKRREQVVRQVNRPTFETSAGRRLPVHLIRGSPRSANGGPELCLVLETRLASEH